MGEYFTSQLFCKGFQTHIRIGAQRLSAMFHRVIGSNIKADQLAPRMRKQRPRPGGKILKPGANPDHHIGIGAGGVGTGSPCHAYRAKVHRVIPWQR